MQFGSYRASIRIDDPATGVRRDVRIKVKRLTVPEGTRFARDYHRSANPPSAVMLARHDTPEEQAQKLVKAATQPGEQDQMEHVLTDEQIAQRRLSEMTPDQRALYDRMDAEEEAFSAAFITDTLRRFVRVESGQDLYTLDDFESDETAQTPVVTGADLAAAFGGCETVVRDLLRIVHLENAHGEAIKKVLRPLFGFVPFSVGHATGVDGQTPAPIAEPVSEPVSVAIEGADQSTTDQLCGSAATG